MSIARQGFGLDDLDRALGGGLLPGTLTVLAGATGIGKTQLGLRWAHMGLAGEGRRGVVCDLTSRGDSQNHAEYASRLFDWDLDDYPLTMTPEFDHAWEFDRPIGDYFHPIDRGGRRVTRGDLEAEQWHEWKGDLARIFRCSVGFFYQHLARGSRRVVFDGLEPAERFSDSIQFDFFEYVYHHVLRKEDEWAAREWLREKYRSLRDPGAPPSLRPPTRRLPVSLHHAARHARRAADAADRPGGHLRQRQHDHPDGPHAAQRPAGPGPLGGQASRQRLRRGDPAVPDHRGRVRCSK